MVAPVAESCPTLGDPTDCGPPGFSLSMGFPRQEVLRRVAISFSRGSSLEDPGDPTGVSSCATGRFFTAEPRGNGGAGKEVQRLSKVQGWRGTEQGFESIMGTDPAFLTPKAATPGVTLGKLPLLLGPQFSHLKNGQGNNTLSVCKDLNMQLLMLPSPSWFCSQEQTNESDEGLRQGRDFIRFLS